MNKFICVLVLAVSAAFAALGADPIILQFRTTGPDKYPPVDGATEGDDVLIGEYYALVWVKPGSQFFGFNADATLVSNDVNEVIVCLPGAVQRPDKKTEIWIACTTCKEEVTAVKVGSYYVVLLDTRKADGTLAGAVDNVPVRVNGYSLTSAAPLVVTETVTGGTCNESNALAADQVSAVPLDAPVPVVSSVAVLDDGAGNRTLSIGVTNTVEYFSYKAKGVVFEGEAPAVTSTVIDGSTLRGAEVKIVVPAMENAEFFKVIRK